MPEVNFPTNSDGGKPRHGTVLPVTRAQYQKVLGVRSGCGCEVR